MADVELAGSPPAEVAPKEHWKTREKRLREEAAARGETPPATETHGPEVGGTVSPTDGYMDPAQFYGPVMAALLASGRCEPQHLSTFAKKAWTDYRTLVDWARSGGV